MSSSNTSLPLPQYLAQTLKPILPIFNDEISLSSPAAADLLAEAAQQLHTIARMLSSLGVFSENEELDEVGDRELVFMSVPWIIAEVEGRRGNDGREQRLAALKRSKAATENFMGLLDAYQVISDEDKESAGAGDPSTISDPAKRREAKIRQYKWEKELRQKISSMSPGQPSASSSPLAFILELLPEPSGQVKISSGPSTSGRSSPPPTSRALALQLLHLLHTQAVAHQSSLAMELDLLESAPAHLSPVDPEADSSRSRSRLDEDQDATWKLDVQAMNRRMRPKELISGGGKVLRPFVILPSTQGLSDRARVQAEVFREGRRLPTMTVEEYLEEEQRRGNIITGGGQASYDALTATELLELAAEEDGTQDAEEKSEEKRQKEENWAMFTEENKKGAGNTMNRG